MTEHLTSNEFAALPLSAQLKTLDEALVEAEDASPLLGLCSGLRDHAPLAYLTEKLLFEGWLDEAENQRWFADFLVLQPETAVHKVLKTLVDVAAKGGRTKSGKKHSNIVARILIESLLVVPLEALSSMCLIDRALKHHFTEDHDKYQSALVEGCKAALRAGKTERITLDRLAQVTASAMVELEASAEAAGPETQSAFAEMRAELAKSAIIVLRDAPKAVSQTNAEELLSRRVYTDPGHFLIELLQNAEDAGASTWRLTFDNQKIVVWHDGTPFDAKDLVGVTSIGQTTKRRQQIGFFGVGFKSIYEVTDRPQVYSGEYCFEIADVSIPKLLGGRPPDIAQDGTVLVLPLRDPSDVERAPRALFEKAHELDPIVLFTLRDVDVIDLLLTEAAGGPQRYTLSEHAQPEMGGASIHQQPDGWKRSYLIQDDVYRYADGLREAGKPEQTKVMVGVRVDEQGLPRPLDSAASTIYSYLPTEEHSGLRFFIQGHFDLPVDRERINPDSRWNQWILTKVPIQLARLAERATTQATLEDRLAMAVGLLSVLPLREELTSPVYRRMTIGLSRAFADVSILPGLDGDLHRATETVIASPELAALFEREGYVDLPEGRRYLLAADVQERERRVARALGAQDFGVEELVALFTERLSDLPDGSTPTDPAVPAFLRRPDPSGMTRLYEVLIDESEDTDRRRGRGSAHLIFSRLRRLPLVLDEEGGLRRVRPLQGGMRPMRGAPAIREIYAGFCAFVHQDLDLVTKEEEDKDSEEGATPHPATAFFDRVGVRRLDSADVVRSLEANLKDVEGPLESATAVGFPGSKERLELILRHVAEAAYAVQVRVSKLPLFPAMDGKLYPIAKNQDDLKGILAVAPDETGKKLRGFYGTRRPLVDETAAQGAVGTVFARINAPSLGLSTLLADLQREPSLFELHIQGARRLHELLEGVRKDTSSRARDILGTLAIWPDTEGRCHPLLGAGAVRVPGNDDVRDLFPEAPFLDSEVRKRRHLSDMNVDTVGAAAVIEALSPESEAPLSIPATADAIAGVLRFLLKHGDRLRSKSRETLAQCAAFLSDTGRVCRLDELHQPSSRALRNLYGEYGGRHFLEIVSEGEEECLTGQVIAKMELGSRLPQADVSTLIDDLEALAAELHGRDPVDGVLPLIRDRAGLEALFDFLVAEVPGMTRRLVDRAVKLPIFPDETGRLCVLGKLSDGGWPPGSAILVEDELRVFFAAAAVPLVDAEVQQNLAPLIESGRTERAGLEDLVGLLMQLKSVPRGATPAPIQSEEMLPKLQAVLSRQSRKLERAFSSEVLSDLAIWRSAAGSVVSASVLVDPDQLLDLCQQGTAEREWLDGHRLEDNRDSEICFAILQNVMERRPVVQVLQEMIQRFARPGVPLEEQPGVFGDARSIAVIAAMLLEIDEGRPSTPPGEEFVTVESIPLIDGVRRLRIGGLRRADAETLNLLRGTELAADLLDATLAGEGPGSLRPEILTQVERLREVEVLRAFVRRSSGESDEEEELVPHPFLHEPSRRLELYRWLDSHELEVFSDAECRSLLRECPFFPTTRGTLVAPQALVLDSRLPDLGLDWTPGEEIPATTLSLLSRQLGLGQPRVEELLEVHLVPAYLSAVERHDAPRAAELIRYLSTRFADRSVLELRALFRGRGDEVIPVEVHCENTVRFALPRTLVLPQAEIAGVIDRAFAHNAELLPRPNLERFAQDDREVVARFLRRLGVRDMPSVTVLKPLLEDCPDGNEALAVAELCGLLYHRKRESFKTRMDELPLRSASWILDRTGCLRKPSDLYLWSPDVEALVGDFPELYPHEQVPSFLGDELCNALGFRRSRDIGLQEVLRHIEARRNAESSVPFRVYQWLELGLEEQWLDVGALQRALVNERWICCDDGEYWRHDQVLGAAALRYFGGRRGYWEQGRERCPRLCALFRIPPRITEEVVIDFLNEIGREARRKGDRELLENEPALPRMLLACYVRLVEEKRPLTRLDRSLPIILCSRVGLGESEALHLVPADDPTLLRSDTPTLEALFRDVGTLHLAARGLAEERGAVDMFYDAMGVRRLRDAYSLEIDESGQDCSVAQEGALGAIRGSLRALLAVLPRVKLQRSTLSAEGWVVETRLARLLERNALRAIEGLRVAYRLEGVGQARASAEAVYDPHRQELLLDCALVERPVEHATGLATGLMGCIYDGPGEEQLADIIEILLRLGTRDRMDDYLNRRHFPEAGGGPPRPRERIADRIDEILDYGLDTRLIHHFPELHGCDLRTWRNEELLSRAIPEENTGDDWKEQIRRGARHATPVLLDALGLNNPTKELSEAMIEVLSAPSLGDIPGNIWSARTSGVGELGPLESLRRGNAMPGDNGELSLPLGLQSNTFGMLEARDSSAQVTTDWSPPTFEDLVNRFREIAEQRAAEAGQHGAYDQSASGESTEHTIDTERPAQVKSSPNAESYESFPRVEGDHDEQAQEIRNGRDDHDGFWHRVRRFFGFDLPCDANTSQVIPQWAAPEGNCLTPQRVISSQLWATPQARRELNRVPPSSILAYTPPHLPLPYRYAVMGLGATFSAQDQTWSREGAPSLAVLTEGAPSGQSVLFQGQLGPGTCQLPVPLYSRLRSRPQVLHPRGADELLELVGDESSSSIRVRVKGVAVIVRYEVDILRAPTVATCGNDFDLSRFSNNLVVPTLRYDELPGLVRRWLDERFLDSYAPWEQALAAQEFVQRHYVYDDGFLEREDVQRAVSRLRPGRGNHHLEVLHASRKGKTLGRGICYELNTMVVELLRHLGIPTMVATGWLLNEGVADRPDHLFALTLLPSVSGQPCIFPLEASTGVAGPIRPLAISVGEGRRGTRSMLPTPLPRPAIPEVPGPWSVQSVFNVPNEEERRRGLEKLREAERDRLSMEEVLLRRVILLYCRVQGVEDPPALEKFSEDQHDLDSLSQRVRELRNIADELLGNAALVGTAISLMRGELAAGFSVLPEEIRDLVRLGIAQVQSVPKHVVWPADEDLSE